MPTRMTVITRALRPYPFTAAVVLAMLLIAVATGTLWSALNEKDWYPEVAYGLPSLEAGRWWTPVTGSFFAQIPLQYVPVAGGFALLVGFAERHLGTARTAAVTVLAQLFGVLGASALLAVLRQTSSTWAQTTAETLDVGFSAGAIGAVAAASAALVPPWRGRVRAVLVLYVVVSVVFVGVLWDVEHLLALAVGLPLGPRLVGRDARLRLPRMSRRELRLVAAAFFWVSAVLVVLGGTISVEGPLGHFGDIDESRWAVVLVALLDVLIGFGLRRGSRAWWRVGMAVTLVSAAVATLVLATLVIGGAEDGVGVTALTAILDLGTVAVLWVGRLAFRNPGGRVRARAGRSVFAATPSQDDRDAAQHDLRAAGSPNRLAWMTTWPENHWWFSSERAGYVAYRTHAGVAIGLADPVARTETGRADLTWSFIDAASDAGFLPCLFSCTGEVAQLARSRGWIRLQVAEEAIIDLPELEFRGKKWQDVRTALNQATKLGIEFKLLRLAEAPRGLQVQVRAISEQWMGDKGLPEMGFTLGGVDEALDPNVLVGLAVDADGTVHGVTSWMPAYGPGGTLDGWTLDVMRRVPDGFRYTMEFLIASACVQFKEQGLSFVSLSGAPLARSGAGDDDVDRTPLDQMLDKLGETLEPYYGFRSLHSFKNKFQPRYEPMYLVVPDEAALPRVGIALTRAYLPEASLTTLTTLATARR